jgi:hypothetical protein
MDDKKRIDETIIKKWRELLIQRKSEIKKDDNMKRVSRINVRFKANVERPVKLLELHAKSDEDRIGVLNFCIKNLDKTLEELVSEICNLTRNELLASTEREKKKALDQIAILRLRVEEKKKMLNDSNQELLILTPKARISREKANSLRKEMGCTVESFISYLERLQRER